MNFKNIRLFGGCAAAAAFSYLAFEGLEWGMLREAIGSVGPATVVSSLALLAAGFGARILRWGYMLRALDPALLVRRCAWPFIAGLAVNNTLPLRAGDVLRAVGFRDELQSGSSRIMSTLVVERLLDLLTLLMLFSVGLLWMGPAALPRSFVLLSVLAGGLGVALLGGVFFLPHRAEWVCRWCLQRPFVKHRRWAKATRAWLSDFWQSFYALRAPRLNVKLVALSLMAWIFEGGMFAVVARALNMNASGLAPWFSLSTGTLATLLPSTPGHVGTFDYFTRLGMVAYGAPEAMTAAFVVIVHLLLWAPVTMLGWGYLLASQGHTSALEIKRELNQA